MTKIKICGIRDRAALSAAEVAGADFAGFVFFEKSPRHLSLGEAAPLVTSTRLQTVGLFVDPTDDVLRDTLKIVPLKTIQLHGHETPGRVAAVRALTGLPVIKAIRIADADDLMAVDNYTSVADWLLFDAKASGAALPGGNGLNFDWSILKDFKSRIPWMLAGGLNADNIQSALSTLTPDAVDVSSGIEIAPGVKDAGKISRFVANLRAGRTNHAT